MFNNNSARGREDRALAPPAMPASTPAINNGGKRGMFSVLGADVVITGNIAATADLHVDGRVDGDVDCGTLIQGAESRISGAVTAESARLAGSIEGLVRVQQLTIERSARIVGDIEYENITIENGGHIDGRLKHMSVAASAPKPRAETKPEPIAPIEPMHSLSDAAE